MAGEPPTSRHAHSTLEVAIWVEPDGLADFSSNFLRVEL